MNRILIIGAGQLGSRHLQALKNVSTKLDINVIDPSNDSLRIAKERYDLLASTNEINHIVSYSTELGTINQADIVIVATNADVRRTIVEKILSQINVHFLILEKLLFDKPPDYPEVQHMIQKKGVKTWVNCSMRTMPFYSNLKQKFKSTKVHYYVTGSQFGLITNSIHYLDYFSYLTDNDEFTIDTSLLDPNPIESKRKGFLEMNGSLVISGKDGSNACFTCFAEGNQPLQAEIISQNFNCISRETQSKALISSSEDDWKFKEIDTAIPFQSTMTTGVVEKLLNNGTCDLSPFDHSVKLHQVLLESLRSYLESTLNKKIDYYPFT